MCSSYTLFASTVGKSLYHSHDDIMNTAEEFINDSIDSDNENIKVSVKSLDKRLRLSKCLTPLNAFWPPGSKNTGHTTVGIRCEHDSKPWKIFVSANVKQFAEVWVTRVAVARGSILTENSAVLDWREISHRSIQYYTNEQNPIGLVTKRPLRIGDILSPTALDKPIAIKRGDKVIVIARKNGLEIRATATALNSAAKGDRIKVRNIASDKVMEGTLFDDSIVYVNI